MSGRRETGPDRQGAGSGQVEVQDFRRRCRDRLRGRAGIRRDRAVLLDIIAGGDGDVQRCRRQLGRRDGETADGREAVERGTIRIERRRPAGVAEGGLA